MSRAIEDRNRRMLRSRDAMDGAFAQPLEVPALARVADASPAHFSRQFRATFGETPHRYLQRAAWSPDRVPTTMRPPCRSGSSWRRVPQAA